MNRSLIMVMLLFINSHLVNLNAGQNNDEKKSPTLAQKKQYVHKKIALLRKNSGQRLDRLKNEPLATNKKALSQAIKAHVS